MAAICTTSRDDVPVATIPDRFIIRSEIENLSRTIIDLGAEKVVVALKDNRGSFPAKELLTCKTAGVEVIEGHSFYEMLTGKLLVTQINPSLADLFRRV